MNLTEMAWIVSHRWSLALVAVILFAFWTLLQLLEKPMEEEPEPMQLQSQEELNVYVKCHGERLAETLRRKRFDLY